MLRGPDFPIQASASQTRTCDKRWEFTIPEVQIYAVQFRRVKFSFFSRQDLEKAQLQHGGLWEVYLGGRDDREEDRVVQAEIQDDIGEEDLESEFESLRFGEEVILYIA
ncbi:hypothetical protein BDZ91DRAFT_747356 [Kalaharituber pfeilii]|nr:hypothetical protein BDZ91DRAFT_747356 [Kalaharituber pfeilii]